MSITAGKRLRGLAREQRVERQRIIGWRYIPIVAGYCALSSMLILWLAWMSTSAITWFACGFCVGASLFFLWVIADSATASRLESAAIAEQNTESEVRKLRSRGWQVVSNVPFHKSDVDHVAIGPGGVFVLETKWSEGSLFDRDGAVSDFGKKAITQVRKNADRIDGVLRQNGYHGGVTGALVVVWGCDVPVDGRHEWPSTDVTMLRGGLLGERLRSADVVLDSSQVLIAAAALDTFVAARLQRIEEESRLERSKAKTGVGRAAVAPASGTLAR